MVTYGTGPVVLEMLDAVARYTPIAHEVIVVDCLPADPTTRTSLLLADRSDIRLLAVDDNLGFAGGNEYGVEHARGEFLCFLNADVIVGPGWLEPLIAALDDPVVGIAAPVFVNDDGSLQEAGQLIFADTFTAPVGDAVMPGDFTNVFSRDVDYASAACWLVRRADHLALGGFDRHYHPAYFEDADYALRVEASGQTHATRRRRPAGPPARPRHRQTRDAALGQNTHARFKRQWAAHLADRPARPTTTVEAIAARDRLCGTTHTDRRVVRPRQPTSSGRTRSSRRSSSPRRRHGIA